MRIEHRIVKLENGSVTELLTPETRRVACGVGDQSSRIDRLEYLSSERERENRLLQVVITHPDIDNNCTQLTEHIREFFSSTMPMISREIDTGMAVIRRGRDHTVMDTFSARRFKTFLFAARKKRRDNEAQESELFVNENLTQYNFSPLKLLKTEKKKRIQMGTNSFTSVFSFDVKIYVKTAADSERLLSVHRYFGWR